MLRDPIPCNLFDCIDWESLQAEGIIAEDYKAAFAMFRTGWDAMNAKRGYPFAGNPDVWRIEFEFVSNTNGRRRKITGASAAHALA